VRARLWKIELQKLADELQMPIKVCHYPPCEWRSGQIPNTATGVGLGEDWRSLRILFR
jgi:hypothetical protein